MVDGDDSVPHVSHRDLPVSIYIQHAERIGSLVGRQKALQILERDMIPGPQEFPSAIKQTLHIQIGLTLCSAA